MGNSKEIKVVSGNGKKIKISDVKEHLDIEKPKDDIKKDKIIIPKEKGKK